MFFREDFVKRIRVKTMSTSIRGVKAVRGPVRRVNSVAEE